MTPYFVQTRNLLLILGILLPCSANAETFGPFNAEVIRVIDGDTIKVRARLWPGLAQTINLRLDGVNTPEKRRAPACEKALGRRASAFTSAFLGTSPIRIYSVRNGKYAGRVLGRIEVPGKGFLGPALVKAGLAREYHGGKRRPWCSDQP